MKRKRARAEDQDVADQPVSDPDLEQSAAKESDEDAAQPTQLASTGEHKRSKLQKRLDKLKDTYDRKGSKSQPEPVLCRPRIGFLVSSQPFRLSPPGVIYVSRVPPHLVRFLWTRIR